MNDTARQDDTISQTDTTSRAYFEQKYQQSPDPWNFVGSAYERGRYAAILASLDGRRYHYAFEPGCSIGVLTHALASLCDHVDAIELSPTAAALARERCAALPNVSIRCAHLDAAIPSSFDLLVFSEIGYYFSPHDLPHILARCVESLAPQGTLLAAHWLGFSPDHILSGDTVHDTIASLSGIHLEHSERHNDFRLDRWRKLSEARL